MNDPAYVEPAHMNPFKRLIFMAVFFALFGAVRLMIWALVLMQFLAHIFTGKVTKFGQRWGKALSGWVHKMLLFMTYNTECMPFPFTGFGAEED